MEKNKECSFCNMNGAESDIGHRLDCPVGNAKLEEAIKMTNPLKSQIAANRERFDEKFPYIPHNDNFGADGSVTGGSDIKQEVDEFLTTSQTSLLQTAIAAVEEMKQKEPETCACQPYKKVMCAWHASQPHINSALSKVVELLKGGITD